MPPLEKTEMTEGWPGCILPVGELKWPQIWTFGEFTENWGQENKISLPNSGPEGVFP